MTVKDLLEFRVTGDVQDVNFRSFAQTHATKLGLKGYVHNHPGGTVDGLAIGPANAITKFKEYLRDGPPAAEVTGVEVIKEQHGISDDEAAELTKGLSGFEVRAYKN
ncbi:hypothetical protein Q5752_002922 [Cryptotrichosporon argae]